MGKWTARVAGGAPSYEDPLADEVDVELCDGELARTEASSEEVTRLVLDHIDHGTRLARSFLARWGGKLSKDQVLSVVGVALCEAASRYDSGKGVRFKTFFFYYLKGLLLRELRKQQDDLYKASISFSEEDGAGGVEETLARNWPDAPVVERCTPESIVQMRQSIQMCLNACAQLDPLQKEILFRHFLWEHSLTEIAESLGYSRCHVSRVKGSALKRLHRMLPHLVEDFSVVSRNGASLSPARHSYTGGRGRRKNNLLHLIQTHPPD